MTGSMGTHAMRRAIMGLAIGLLGCVGCLHAPMPWSPDGSWIAYTVEVRPLDQILAPGWIFGSAQTDARKSTGASASGYRLWATRGATNTSVLLEDSPTPITAPGWSPDGHALAFGRVVTANDRASRFEVVILEGLARRRVVSSRPLTALDAEVSRLPLQAVAWSPDGRYLAVPQLEPEGLAIIRADNGRTVNAIPDAFLPSWSPTGGRLAFYVRTGDHALHCVDSALGQPRALLDVGQASQAPIWSRDGTSIVVTRRLNRQVGEQSDQTDLVRVRLDNSAVETVRNLSADLGPNRDHSIEGTSITFDRDAENLFCATMLAGQPNSVTWYRPRNNEVLKKFTMVDPSIPVGSLSFSPDGRTLAARLGTTDHLSAPVFCDMETNDLRTRLVAPDDPSRLDWIATLIQSSRTILANLPPVSVRLAPGPATSIARPTILPLLTELTTQPESLARLKRIGKLGRPLCDRPSDSPAISPTTRQVLDEARLFFDYLRADYTAALLDLGALEDAADSPKRRLALLTIRAQILVNQGQFTAANRLIGFLDQIDRPVAQRAEWVGDRSVLTADPRPDRGWPRHLAESVAQLQDSLTELKRVEPKFDFAPSRDSNLFKPEAPAPNQFRPNPLIPPGGGDQPAPRRKVVPRANGPGNSKPPKN